MHALRFTNNELNLLKGPTPQVAENEALVRVTLAGICATDLEIFKGYMGFEGTLGHEFVGVVETCEAIPELEGKRVVGEINASCGYCDMCRMNLGRHCYNRTVLGIMGRDGAFAEYLTLPADNLHTVPDEIPDNMAVFTEPLAAAFEIVEQVHIQPGTPVLVVGDGRLAQLVVRVLNRVGAHVEVVGHHETKLRRMKGHIARAYLNKTPPGAKYPFVVEASGTPDGWKSAMSAIQPRGTIVLKSTYAASFDYNPAPLVTDEITVVGSRCGQFAPAITAMASGLNVSDLIDAEFTLKDWKKAFETAKKPDVVKVIFSIKN